VPASLCSDGPLGQDDPQPRRDFTQLQNLMHAVLTRGQWTYVGKLDQSELGLGERLAGKVVRAPEGDLLGLGSGWAREIGWRA
jgi:hypothetical protein